ncbi:hypothetical protein BC834DRAFT_875840 [Gloeopeniophorella convolvens]|nr:hypothetical protein BC834DRAFT_875840 [Gloeopeniophorella convolvens]
MLQADRSAALTMCTRRCTSTSRKAAATHPAMCGRRPRDAPRCGMLAGSRGACTRRCCMLRRRTRGCCPTGHAVRSPGRAPCTPQHAVRHATAAVATQSPATSRDGGPSCAPQDVGAMPCARCCAPCATARGAPQTGVRAHILSGACMGMHGLVRTRGMPRNVPMPNRILMGVAEDGRGGAGAQLTCPALATPTPAMTDHIPARHNWHRRRWWKVMQRRRHSGKCRVGGVERWWQVRRKLGLQRHRCEAGAGEG